jgi:hypothetical protein
MVYGIQEGAFGSRNNMKLTACFLLMSAGVCSAVLADEPPPAPQPPAVQAPAPSAASSASDAKPVSSAASSASDVKSASGTAAAPSAPKADKTEVASAGPTEAEIKQMRGRGFKPVTRNGTMLFCRDEGQIGTHFQRTRCSTLEQLKQAEQTGKEYVNSIQQQGSAVPFKGP